MRLRSKIENSLSEHVLRVREIGLSYCELRTPSEQAFSKSNG